MVNIGKIHNCYGCGVCAIACRKKIIEITLNGNGFYEPRINKPDECTNCGLCIDVCAFSHNDLSSQNSPVRSYAAWSKEPAVRRKCSSGGVGFEIGRFLLGQGYKVCGVRYNAEKGIAEHYIASTVEELTHTIGSKYIQSYTLDGFRAMKKRDKYLVTGTPCQIDSFRRYIKKLRIEDSFVLMDFFCHAVPSKQMWDKYLHQVEKVTGKAEHASWRNKASGWHDSYDIIVSGKSKTIYSSRWSQGDVFYKLFLGDYCSNPACSKCKFKYDRSAADIRIGDLWGNTYATEEKGVSAAVAFTECGEKVLKKTDCELRPHPFHIVAEGQQRESIKPAHTSWIVKLLLRVPIASFPDAVWKTVFLVEKVTRIPGKILEIVRKR